MLSILRCAHYRARFVGLGGWRNRGIYPVGLFRYPAGMTKRLVEIDDQLLARARTVAGTDTIKATVETALRSLVDQDTALHHVARLRKPGVLDIDRINEARRPRTGADG
jgi:Arc/MetJ family transcription regulator